MSKRSAYDVLVSSDDLLPLAACHASPTSSPALTWAALQRSRPSLHSTVTPVDARFVNSTRALAACAHGLETVRTC